MTQKLNYISNINPEYMIPQTYPQMDPNIYQRNYITQSSFPRISQNPRTNIYNKNYINNCNKNLSQFTDFSTQSNLYSTQNTLYSNTIEEDKKQKLTSEITSILSSSLANLSPTISKKCAQRIFEIISPYLEQRDKEIKDIIKKLNNIHSFFINLHKLDNIPTKLEGFEKVKETFDKIDNSINNLSYDFNQRNMQMKKQEIDMQTQLRKLNILKDALICLKNTSHVDNISNIQNELKNTHQNLTLIQSNFKEHIKGLQNDLESKNIDYDSSQNAFHCLNNFRQTIDGFVNGIQDCQKDNNIDSKQSHIDLNYNLSKSSDNSYSQNINSTGSVRSSNKKNKKKNILPVGFHF